jgi:hypothetical protein
MAELLGPAAPRWLLLLLAVVVREVREALMPVCRMICSLSCIAASSNGRRRGAAGAAAVEAVEEAAAAAAAAAAAPSPPPALQAAAVAGMGPFILKLLPALRLEILAYFVTGRASMIACGVLLQRADPAPDTVTPSSAACLIRRAILHIL